MPAVKHLHSVELSALQPFKDFEEACHAILVYLKGIIDFRLWMITRTEGNEWIVLSALDKTDQIRAGKVFKWSDSFCYQMVTGRGPQFAPDARDVEVYRETPIAQQMKIGAYIGMPIVRADGTLFGTLCGVDPEPVSSEITEYMGLISLLSRQLATLFELENQFEREQRLRERIEAEAMVDEMTKVYNRRGWQRLLEKEEQRCVRYGHPAGVLIIDLDELKGINDTKGHHAGDELLQQAANILVQSSRASDIVARIGGDEFAILCVEANEAITEKLSGHVQLFLANAGIGASVGWASRHGEVDIDQAIKQADRMMYEHKRLRKELPCKSYNGA